MLLLIPQNPIARGTNPLLFLFYSNLADICPKWHGEGKRGVWGEGRGSERTGQ